MFNVYPQPAATNRFVLKSNTAGQILLPSMSSPASATTSSTSVAFGAWAEVTSATAAEYYVTGVLAFADAADATASVYAPLYVDIGMGGAGSETSLSVVPVGSSIGRFNTTSPKFAPGGHQLLDAPIRVAAGSRLAVRTALASTASVARACTVYLLAVPYSAVEGN